MLARAVLCRCMLVAGALRRGWHHTRKAQHTLCAGCLQVCDTIVTTVPKSVVHCLVRKAEKNLLNHMFGHVHKMSEVEIERMLQVRAWAKAAMVLVWLAFLVELGW